MKRAGILSLVVLFVFFAGCADQQTVIEPVAESTLPLGIVPSSRPGSLIKGQIRGARITGRKQKNPPHVSHQVRVVTN